MLLSKNENVKVTLFFDIAQRSLVQIQRRFGGTCCLHFQEKKKKSLHDVTCQHTHIHRRVNLKSQERKPLLPSLDTKVRPVFCTVNFGLPKKYKASGYLHTGSLGNQKSNAVFSKTCTAEVKGFQKNPAATSNFYTY